MTLIVSLLITLTHKIQYKYFCLTIKIPLLALYHNVQAAIAMQNLNICLEALQIFL